MFSWRKLAVRRRVVVNLKSGTAVVGVLWSQRGPLLELRHADVIDPAGTKTSAPGVILVERENVDFVQLPEV